MTAIEYKRETKKLFERWRRERPEYERDGFVRDGVAKSNYENWSNSKPKTLFLLKEAHLDGDAWEPEQGITLNGGGRFSRNLARWHQIIKGLLVDLSNIPSLNELDHILPKEIVDIALVELKKANQGFSTSDYNDIKRYAVRDKALLSSQIDLIQPEVVVCCGIGNFDAYWNIIYGDEDGKELSERCYKHRKRLVIDFYHPSARKGDEKMYSTLCEMVSGGKVFESFSWARK